jgi:putative chitinase
MNAAILSRAIDCPMLRAVRWIEPLTKAMQRYQINTVARQAAFLAQIGHESGRLFYVREIASGAAYEGRKDLGNTAPGDGRKYKGRGLIQITGRNNYTLCGNALGLDLVTNPELLEVPHNAAMSAAWFWFNNKLNDLADKGDFKKITRRINGGYNGLADRISLHASALKALETVCE